MAAKILLGTEKIENMPIAYAPATKKYNETIVNELGISIPDGYDKIG